MANEIKKVLAAQQDMLFGEGTETQTRGEEELVVDKIRAGYYPCADTAEMAALDPVQFPRASIINDSGKLEFYVWDGTQYVYVQVDGTDLEGKETAVTWLDGTSYMQLDQPLPGLTADGETTKVNIMAKLYVKGGTRYLVGEGDNQTIYSSLAIRDTFFVVTDSTGTEQTTDLTALNLPVEEFIQLEIEAAQNAGNKAYRLGYNGVYTNWVTDNTISGNWLKFFGHGVPATGIFGATQSVQFFDAAALEYNWSFSNVQGRIIYCNIFGYNGQILGSEYENSDPLFSDALAVTFDNTGTAYQATSTNVDAALRDIDKNFQRKHTGEVVEPTPPDDTPMEANEIWLADSSAPTSRPLPANPIDGTEVTIRDDVGLAGTNTITIARAGRTIMGLAVDMTITSNWSWVRLKYFETLDDWRVVGGGVGGQVKIIQDEIANMLYPVGHVLLTMNPDNPASYFLFGVWQKTAIGSVLAGIGESTDTNGVAKDIPEYYTPGEWVHIQTEEEMAEHFHESEMIVQAVNKDGGSNAYVRSSAGTLETDSRGSNTPFNVANPMYGVHVWERVA